MKRGKDKKGLPFFGIPKLAPYLKPYKMLFFWMVVTGTVGSGMDAIIPLFQQHAIDHFIADKTMQGVGGWLAAPLFLVSQSLGNLAQKAFAGIVLGGFGSIKGAVVGCLLIGLIESFSVLITDNYKDAIVFLVLIVVLVIRPTGIFGEKIAEKA